MLTNGAHQMEWIMNSEGNKVGVGGGGGTE